MQSNPTERVWLKGEVDPTPGLRPSLGVWTAEGADLAALSIWAARDAPEPEVFHPARARRGRGRTEE